jgi:acyl-CoA synthetase (AMP-forming)/AMP-acid ligase II
MRGRALARGATLVTLPRFDVTGFLAAIQDHRITQTVVVPPIMLALARHPAVDQYDLSSLEWLGCGAAPLSAELQQACAELPKAYVVPARPITPQELIDYVAARVAPYKRIHQVAFTDAIPTSPSGKTLRRLLVAGEQHRS